MKFSSTIISLGIALLTAFVTGASASTASKHEVTSGLRGIPCQINEIMNSTSVPCSEYAETILKKEENAEKNGDPQTGAETAAVVELVSVEKKMVTTLVVMPLLLAFLLVTFALQSSWLHFLIRVQRKRIQELEALLKVAHAEDDDDATAATNNENMA